MEMKRHIPAQKERAGTYVSLSRAVRKQNPSLLKTLEPVDELMFFNALDANLRVKQRLHLPVDKTKLSFA